MQRSISSQPTTPDVTQSIVTLTQSDGFGTNDDYTLDIAESLRNLAGQVETLQSLGFTIRLDQMRFDPYTTMLSITLMRDPRACRDLPITTLESNLPLTTYTALRKHAKVRTVRDLTTKTRQQLLETKGIGKIGVQKIEDVLRRIDLQLGMAP